MRKLAGICLLSALPWTAGGLAGQQGASAEYIGGTLPTLDNRTGGRLHTTDDDYLIFDCDETVIRIPYDRINLLEYGQKVDRRYLAALVISPMLLLSKSRAHYLTVGFSDDSGRQQAMIYRVSKKDIRPVLVSLEARTGVKIQYQDNEARKAGRG
ncbi:MAG: hypothetical protein ACK5AZ_22390 [Bryobacteraceae bacterium]